MHVCVYLYVRVGSVERIASPMDAVGWNFKIQQIRSNLEFGDKLFDSLRHAFGVWHSCRRRRTIHTATARSDCDVVDRCGHA